MEGSILNDIKKMLGLSDDYDAFDTDIIIHINSILMVLNQLGIGTSKCFTITGETETWSDFDPEIDNVEAVKTYVYLRTRILFDPPSTSFVIEAMDKQLAELEWRLREQKEAT